jgi:hypothetical protein
MNNGTSGYSKHLMDTQTGNMYSNSNLELGIQDSYAILYLATPNFSVSEVTNLTTKIAPTDETYTSSDLYFSVSNTTTKHLANTLGYAISGNVTLSVDCNSVGKIKYESDTGEKQTWNRGDYTCQDNQVTLFINQIDPSTSSNEFEVNYDCSNLTRVGYKLVMIFASLILLTFVISFSYSSFKEGKLDLGQLIMVFVAIVVCLALWLASGQNLGNSCGVVG